eukprot:8632590-Pyramimonas_sp.AAC.1
MCVKRKQLAKWHAKPFMEAAVGGALVLLNIGQGVYRVRRVIGPVLHDPHSGAELEKYDIQKGQETAKWLLLEWEGRHAVRMNGVSNSEPSEEQIEEWRASLPAEGARWPTSAEADVAVKRITWATAGGEGDPPRLM